MSKIEIYTANTCGYCKQLKDELTKNNMEFEEKSTNDFKDEFQNIANLVGIGTTPTIKYKGEYFVPGRDFQNPDQLINMVENYKISPYNEREKIFQKIKTLNYHMNMAFGRVDQLLRQIETKINKDEH